MMLNRFNYTRNTFTLNNYKDINIINYYMNKLRHFTVIGKNRIGLISDVTKTIFDTGSNIHTTNVKRYNDDVILSVSAEVPEKVKTTDFIIKNNCYLVEDNLDIMKDLYNNVFLKVQLSDSPGIIHTTTSQLATYNANIIRLKAFTTIAPHSSMDLFNLNIDTEIPKIIDLAHVKHELINILDEKYGATVKLIIEDIN